MSTFVKVVGLIFLPLAAIVLIFTMLNSGSGKSGRGFFIKEYDEQNIYG